MPITMTKKEKDEIEGELFLLVDYIPKKYRWNKNVEMTLEGWQQVYKFCQATKEEAETLASVMECAAGNAKTVLSEYYGEEV